MSSFAEMLAPIDFQSFVRDYWEKRPLHVRGAAGRFEGLLDAREFEELLHWHGLRRGDLRVAGLAEPELTERVFCAKTGRLDVGTLREAHAAGASVILEMVQWLSPAVSRLCTSAEGAFGQPVTANAVLTPATRQGFQLHFDYQDVFIAQIQGRKHWTIHEPLVTLPIEEQFRFPLDPTRLGAPVLEVELAPGDLLFIPRGFIHAARAAEHASLQLGIGVHCCRVHELVALALDALAQCEPTLRGALPPGALAGTVTEVLDAEFRTRFGAALRSLDLEAGLARFRERHARWRRPVVGGAS